MRMTHVMRMAIAGAVLATAGACGSSGSAPPAAEPAAPAPPSSSLYRSLGGYDAIAALTDDFIGRMLKDSTLAPFFAGLEKPELQRIRQMVVDQLCAATGGPCVYVGHTMKDAHAKLNITPADWQQAVRLLNASLDKFGVGRSDRNQLLAIVRTLEPDIVTAK
jgi:hemoglobin